MRSISTGLATAFFRFYLLDALGEGPARPIALLAHVTRQALPFARGAFDRALQSLIEGGYVVPARHGEVALSRLGAIERMEERERWLAMLPVVRRILGDDALVG